MRLRNLQAITGVGVCRDLRACTDRYDGIPQGMAERAEREGCGTSHCSDAHQVNRCALPWTEAFASQRQKIGKI